MIVDSSVLIAIVMLEDDADHWVNIIERASVPLRMSAGNWLESTIVVDSKRSEAGSAEFDRMVERLGIEIIPVTAEQARIARRAYQTFGKGSGHPAQLNFGDCFAYALSWESGEPLLFKGQDFSQTDIEAAS
ncbi:MAG TPA: type II toxin-antitoxin system VapC family toxin [Chakrabartia sp.]|jgi:ribonuclease VapC|nr:type II toxin-antitoxin system VapC family toxin [Chakrabartia sp.]